ncbi:hypothetical protein [Mycobacterium sp. PSTR-4-N]|uniref:hypothetical protein n=1 Tax=Mycobacterium sp. PSTR-4-N TaxID=2917745 RepID=UPI001F1525E2|nr:hypothetical protein [Mycobacterium sp. PSTR-4-N]MCG7596317.1 hypothetical protein [Mycobacterium sp. PSTR-4-N]
MSYTINCTLTVAYDCSFEVGERHLEVMRAHGVDVTDEFAVSDWYRGHVDQEIDGVWFRGLARIADDDHHTSYLPEIVDWDIEGDPPERFWEAEAAQ